MAKTQSREVAREEEAPRRAVSTNATNMPDFMRGDAGRGTEGWEASDYEMPRIKLLQGISPELQMYDGLRAGEFWHTVAEESLGPTLQVVVTHVSKRYVLWCPRPPVDAGGILARADDAVHWNPPNAEFTVKVDRRGRQVTWKTADTVAKSGLAEWGTYDPEDPKSPPAATECIVVVVALPDHPELSPVALMLQRSALPAARKLRGKLKFTGAPIYGLRFNMTSFVDESSAGQFNNYRFESAGFVEDQAQYDLYKRMFENFEATGVQVRDIEGAGDDEAGGPSEAQERVAAAGDAAAREKTF